MRWNTIVGRSVRNNPITNDPETLISTVPSVCDPLAFVTQRPT